MRLINISLIGAAVLAAGAAAAHDSPKAARHIDASQYYGLYSNWSPRATAPATYDHSGTSGREGFGEDPAYPEGPGDVAD